MLANQNRPYNSDDLRMLSRVLKEALEDLECDAAPVSDAQVQEVGSRLAKAIMNHFEAGETDPDVLKAIAVNSMRRESRAYLR
jgi:hypothetical protein